MPGSLPSRRARRERLPSGGRGVAFSCMVAPLAGEARPFYGRTLGRCREGVDDRAEAGSDRERDDQEDDREADGGAAGDDAGQRLAAAAELARRGRDLAPGLEAKDHRRNAQAQRHDNQDAAAAREWREEEADDA